MKSLLILDNDPETITLLHHLLTGQFDLIESAGSLEVATELLGRCHFDLVIAEHQLADGCALTWLQTRREQGWRVPVIFMAVQADLTTVLSALRVQAVDFLMKPFAPGAVAGAVAKGMAQGIAQQPLPQLLWRSADTCQSQAVPEGTVAGIVGECHEMRQVCRIISQIAPMPSTVLIEGESGTGKELAARAIHELSERKGNFVAINCGGISHELLESELFGHVKGAFTGAHQAREGLFAYADGGTLLLDEMGEMPMPLQMHLLRVLEERTIRPVGSNQEAPLDVRILAATNRDLSGAVKAGRFREDLFYRLNVLSLRMPPLRERPGDVVLLLNHFAHKLAQDLGVERPDYNPQEIKRLGAYHWPGNVRELKNVVERSLLLQNLPSQCIQGTRPIEPCSADERLPAPPSETDTDTKSLLLEDVEKQHILRVLAMQAGNKSAAARELGISRKTMERKLKAWGLF